MSSLIKQVFSSIKVSRERWHSRLGHPAIQIVQHVLHRHELPSVSNNNSVICDACQQGKSHQLPFSLSTRVTTSPLEIIYSDVWGPAQTSVSGHQFYVSFIDAYSRFTWLYLLKHKSDVFQFFLQFQQHVERLLGKKSYMFNLIGVVNIIDSVNFSRILAFLIVSLVHILINKMALLNENIVILSKLVLHSWHMLPSHIVFGVMPSPLHVSSLTNYLVAPSPCKLLLSAF